MARFRDVEGVSRGGETFVVDPSIIREPSGDYENARRMDSDETREHISNMARHIVRFGAKGFPPIRIYQSGDGKYYVLDGWCRRRAHTEAMQNGADIKGIRAELVPEPTPEEYAISTLTSNNSKHLSPLEKASRVKWLLDRNWSAEDVADRLGWSLQTVNNLLDLLNAPAEIRGHVERKEISATEAMKQVRRNPETAGIAIKAAIEKAHTEGRSKATARHTKKAFDLGKFIKDIKELSAEEFDLVYDAVVAEQERRDDS